MQNDILFDNIYIGHSIEDAEKLKAETFDLKHAAEKAEEEANAPKPEDTPTDASGLSFKDDPVTFIKEKVSLFTSLFARDPIEAIKFVPEVSGTIGAVLVALIAILASSLSGGNAAATKEKAKDAAKKAKDVAADAKDKVTEAVATGAEKAQAEVNKRTTRSTAS